MSPEKSNDRPWTRRSRVIYPNIEAYPQAIIDEIKNKGEQKISPFWALSKFGQTFAKGKQDLVIALISQTTHAHEINFIETNKGIRIFANNIEPLIAAANEIYPNTLELMPKHTRKAFNKAFAPTNHTPEEDWKR